MLQLESPDKLKKIPRLLTGRLIFSKYLSFNCKFENTVKHLEGCHIGQKGIEQCSIPAEGTLVDCNEVT